MLFLALTLGLKHGLDLDHLATIDAITRAVRKNSLLSKMVGFFFSLGHGLVVIAISLIIGGGLLQSHIPKWLEGFGSWVSVFFLITFGLLNLWSVFRNPASPLPGGVKSFLTKKIPATRYNALFIMLIGALFAISFDTFSQIALFSISGTLLSGWLLSGALGVCFTFGMMITDGLNGLFVSKLCQRADKKSLLLSRGFGLAISLFSLILGLIGLFKLIDF